MATRTKLAQWWNEKERSREGGSEGSVSRSVCVCACVCVWLAAVLGAFDDGLGVTVQEELAVLQMRIDVNAGRELLCFESKTEKQKGPAGKAKHLNSKYRSFDHPALSKP